MFSYDISFLLFFFKQKTAYEMRISDWSSDVCSSDLSEKRTLFDLLDAERNASITLTESFAMWPGAAVSGFYFSHPESRYFGIGKEIGRASCRERVCQ